MTSDKIARDADVTAGPDTLRARIASALRMRGGTVGDIRAILEANITERVVSVETLEPGDCAIRIDPFSEAAALNALGVIEDSGAAPAGVRFMVRAPLEFSPSAYTDNPKTISGYHPAAPFCPCGTTAPAALECAKCEAFCCTRCDRWVSWVHGCADDSPALCDECTVSLGLTE